jgi:hypothetical protein
MPGRSGVLVVTRVRSITTKCARGRGCSGHPAFPTPSRGRKIYAQLGRIARRDREVASGIVLLLESFEVGLRTKRYLTPRNTTHPSCPDLIRASINLRDNFFRRRWITGSSSAKTRGACHRAALCADPLALQPGADDFNWYDGHCEARSGGRGRDAPVTPPCASLFHHREIPSGGRG